MSTPLHLILLAGGQGLRAAATDGVPKQFRLTKRGALFAVSLREFLTPGAPRTWNLASVTVTAPDSWRDLVCAELAAQNRPWQVAAPGESRTASTWQATQALTAAIAPGPDDLVAVHDAARPFATVALLHALAEAALRSGAAIPGVPMPDTVVQVAGENANPSSGTERPATYLRRETLMAVQTPQVFRWSLLATAHRWAHETGAEFTDDGGLLAARGHPPTVIPGDPDNWKVTTAADWARAAERLG